MSYQGVSASSQILTLERLLREAEAQLEAAVKQRDLLYTAVHAARVALEVAHVYQPALQQWHWVAGSPETLERASKLLNEAFEKVRTAEQPTVVTAFWQVGLECRCPECLATVDLAERRDFWEESMGLAPGEIRVERAESVRVVCPACEACFTVRCTY